MPPAEELYAEVLKLRAELAKAQEMIEWLKRKVFAGSMSERFVGNPATQEILPLVGLPKPVPAPVQTVTYERAVGDGKPRSTPTEAFARLPVSETVEIVPEEVKAQPEAFEKIGEERTFEVDVTPPKLFKREFIRPKFRAKADRTQAPVVAPALPRCVPGGYASAGLVAFVVVSKYCHHLPLARLEKMSCHWGGRLSRQSMADWVAIASDWAEPIYKLMLARLLAGRYVQCDETPIKYLDPDHSGGTTRQGYLWVVSKPGGDVVFSWKTTRQHRVVDELLGKGYTGLLQSDGYEAYRQYVRDHEGVTWIGCWAHVRREIFEAQADRPRIAKAFLRLIQRLYRRERAWDEAGLGAAQRQLERNGSEGLARTMKAIHRLALWTRLKLLPQSPLSKACSYLLNHWEGLRAPLDHGEARLDNNLVENAIRPSCIGKKNFLFIGHPDAGQRSAILYSLIVSCERHGKDPLAYLRDLLTRLPRLTNQDDLTSFLPANWQSPGTVTLAS